MKKVFKIAVLFLITQLIIVSCEEDSPFTGSNPVIDGYVPD